LEGDVWPLPRKTEKVPKFEAEDIKIKSQWDEIEEATDVQMKEDFARGLSEQGGKNGTTKKQGGGFIDSPLYLRDY